MQGALRRQAPGSGGEYSGKQALDTEGGGNEEAGPWRDETVWGDNCRLDTRGQLSTTRTHLLCTHVTGVPAHVLVPSPVAAEWVTVAPASTSSHTWR